ncbi:MAG: hypothetical protein H6625_02900 [Bdellovibrionaceae bacterium]|nr:hypothetical protein [Pseudobdellovibrionaceae bacterium]
MREITIITFILFSMFISSCGKDNESSNLRESNPSVPEKVKDISNLPLEQALKIKYDRILFKCDYKLSLLRPDVLGGVSRTQVEKQFFVWDLLENFNKRTELDIEYKFENVLTRIQWKVEPGLIKEAAIAIENSKNSFYQLTDAVILKGSSLTELIEYNNKGGEMGTSEIVVNEKIYFDRVSEQVTASEFNFSEQDNNSTKFSLNCVLDAKVKPGYEPDFKLVKN